MHKLHIRLFQAVLVLKGLILDTFDYAQNIYPDVTFCTYLQNVH